MPSATESAEKILTAIADVNSDIREMKRSIDTLAILVTGNGEPSKGLTVRVDRLEQNEQRRSTWVKAAIGASVAAMISFIGVLIKMVNK